ncbi:hypothetical protein B0I35DRAFT_434596 [Stachybotrys elegans]|uniref:Protein NO VEIN C-terminal domain-containing protein n=1 Tax=Stachybotrys elegans TaxID=80388 RepID=A0A8K0SQI5_9HYPO|nr:hypothetical protein B0I35DRAFT_434596 [Stachybotrys elegans]
MDNHILTTMDGSASSKAEADAQIETRRQDLCGHGQLDPESGLMSSLQGSLEIIAEQLYRDSCHFMLELIQNADDNEFPNGETASLNFTLSSEGSVSYLRSDCNEVGFTYANLRAITLVGRSTKKSAHGGRKGFIGEKGIGFKSVFKAAEVVHVASGYYEFKFDQKELAGILVPIHSQFPAAQRLQNHTQFLLELKSMKVHDRIERDLRDIEPQLLLFLRKLRRLQIRTRQSTKVYSVRSDLSLTTQFGETSVISISNLSDGIPVEKKFVMARHTIDHMPPDKHRKGVTASEVVLAFPVKGLGVPVTKRQKVFAFLPINDYGFYFLIHADFIVVASRDCLEYDRDWNDAIRREVVQAFSEAIRRFATASSGGPESLRYMWPKYIKHHESGELFWNLLHKAIIRDIGLQPIIQSRDPTAPYYKAVNLRYVPKRFRFGAEPLFDCPSLKKTHLSFNYDKAYDELRLIGMRTLSVSDLVEQLATWLEDNGPAELSNKSNEWHRHMASLFSGETDLRQYLVTLPIVPLVDGSWVDARTDQLYLTSDIDDEHVPEGISIYLVDEHASQDPIRRSFYQFLGIPTYTTRQVCELIGELHSGTPSSMRHRNVSDMITDTAYLFRHRSLYLEASPPSIYFVVSWHGEVSCRKDQVYVTTSLEGSQVVNKYKDVARSPFFLLDERYERAICGDDWMTRGAFHRWLVEAQGVSTLPVLVRDSQLTPEWLFLRDTDVVDLLHVVKADCDNDRLHPRLLSEVPQLTVKCMDGSHCILAETAVPTRSLRQACPHILFADLPTSMDWTFLSRFNITISPTTATRLQELDALSRLPVSSVERNMVEECYRGLSLQANSSADEADILNAFESKPLVFITRPHPEWVSHKSCVWNAPAVLKLVTKLSNRYGECRTLFCELLGVSSATIEHVVNEFCSLQESSLDDTMQRFKELLGTLQEYSGDDHMFTTTQFLRLRHARVFPIIKATVAEDATEPRVVLRSILQDENWYIADRLTLDTAYRSKVDLLDLPVRDNKAFCAVLSKLGCRPKYLSSVVEEKVEPRGLVIRDLAKEKDLRIRLRCIACLGNRQNVTQSEDIVQLRTWIVPSIVITRRLGTITTEEDNSMVTFQETSGLTNVYFRERIPQSKGYNVTFMLSEFFCQQCSIRPEDKNIVNSLLCAPLEDLAEIMISNDRYLPDRVALELLQETSEIRGPQPAITRSPTIPTFPRAPSAPSAPSAHSAPRVPPVSPASPAATRPTTSRAPRSITLSIEDQFRLRDLVPSFQQRQQSVASNARQFRISRDHIARGASHARLRGERHHQSQVPEQQVTIDLATLSETESQLDHRVESEDVQIIDAPLIQTSPPTSEQVRNREIGYLGEYFIHTLFEQRIRGWTFENWTSKLRIDAGHPAFQMHERGFSDFTFVDSDGQMSAFLQQAGMNTDGGWSRSTTYHLEVKTTTGACSEPFHVSQNQLSMMRRYDSDPQHAYILLRVCNIDNIPDVKIYPRPWRLSLEGVLAFVSPTGYQVYDRGIPS